MDWPITRHVERQAVRLHEMMERVGCDPGKLVRLQSGDAYALARQKCLRCSSSRECLLWLEAKTASKERPDFCPNLAVFEQCR
jgi:hypothetical protein